MGLFDKVVKKGLSDALGGALGDKVAQATDALEQATGLDLDGDGRQGGSVFGSPTQSSAVPGQQEAYQQSGQQSSFTPQQATQQVGQTAFSGSGQNPAYLIKTQVTDKAYFSDVIHRNFSAYDIREDVPVAEFGGEGSPYDFALYQNGACVGVIKLLYSKTAKIKAYQGAKAAAEAAGVPFINFYVHMPNVEGFVVERITRLIKP